MIASKAKASQGLTIAAANKIAKGTTKEVTVTITTIKAPPTKSAVLLGASKGRR